MSKRSKYKSVIISLIQVMKLGDILCFSCSLSFSIRGYDRSHSIKINNNGKEKKCEHIMFYNFYFQKKYKRNTTKAIRNTQIA